MFSYFLSQYLIAEKQLIKSFVLEHFITILVVKMEKEIVSNLFVHEPKH